MWLLSAAPLLVQASMDDLPGWSSLLLGPLGVLFALLLALRAYHTGLIVTRKAHDEAMAAAEKAHSEAVAALKDAHEMDRGYLIQHVSDERARTRALEIDFAGRLAKGEEGEAYWRDMALGLLRVQDAERRDKQGRPPRHEAAGGAR